MRHLQSSRLIRYTITPYFNPGKTSNLSFATDTKINVKIKKVSRIQNNCWCRQDWMMNMIWGFLKIIKMIKQGQNLMFHTGTIERDPYLSNWFKIYKFKYFEIDNFVSFNLTSHGGWVVRAVAVQSSKTEILLVPRFESCLVLDFDTHHIPLTLGDYIGPKKNIENSSLSVK